MFIIYDNNNAVQCLLTFITVMVHLMGYLELPKCPSFTEMPVENTEMPLKNTEVPLFSINIKHNFMNSNVEMSFLKFQIINVTIFAMIAIFSQFFFIH